MALTSSQGVWQRHTLCKIGIIEIAGQVKYIHCYSDLSLLHYCSFADYSLCRMHTWQISLYCTDHLKVIQSVYCTTILLHYRKYIDTTYKYSIASRSRCCISLQCCKHPCISIKQQRQFSDFLTLGTLAKLYQM